MPQNAERLDANLTIFSNEILIDVNWLQIDSASFAQLRRAYPKEIEMKKAVLEIVAKRGKMQNPITGSGGMLVGTVERVGSDYPDSFLAEGERVATLVSLTATPLNLKEIHEIDYKKERLKVSAKAILFEKSLYAKMPKDISEGAALAAFDICGAPLLTVKHAKPNDVVFVLGLGKAGRSVLSALRYQFVNQVTLLGADANPDAVTSCQSIFPQGKFSVLNAQHPLEVMDWVHEQTQGWLADLTVNLVNVSHTEMPSILATRDGGCCLFYSMATDFQKATLGCESVGKDVSLIMGTGYTKGHADFMLEVMRQDVKLKEYFEAEFG